MTVKVFHASGRKPKPIWFAKPLAIPLGHIHTQLSTQQSLLPCLEVGLIKDYSNDTQQLMYEFQVSFIPKQGTSESEVAETNPLCPQNRLDEPDFSGGPKSLRTDFGIHH